MYWLPYSSHISYHSSQTPWLPWISYALKNRCSIHARWSKSSLKHSIHFCGLFFPSLKQNSIAYRSCKVSSRPDYIFEIHQLWQSGFSRVYSNSCCSCSFEPEIIKIGQSSHKMSRYNIVNYQDNFECLYTESLETYWMHHVHSHLHTVSLYYNTSVWLNTRDAT